jgi:hypothetical protein
VALAEAAGNVVVAVVYVVAVVSVVDGIVVEMASGGGLQHISDFARPKLLQYHLYCTEIRCQPDFLCQHPGNRVPGAGTFLLLDIALRFAIFWSLLSASP